MKTPEIRTARMAVEFRAADGGLGTLAGYAAKFNTLSRNLGGFVETIEPGAFNKSLADGVRVMARYNHDDMALLGTTDAGTLRLMVDEVGLMYEVDLPDTTMGRDVAALAARGDIHYSSFAFHIPVNGDEWGLTANDYMLRTIRTAHLVDVAPVNDPAYLDTSSGLRQLAASRSLDLAVVTAAAEANDLRRVLTKADLDPQGSDTPQTPTAGQDDIRSALDEARAALAARAM